MSDSLWPHGLRHTRLPCPSLSPGVCSNSCLYWNLTPRVIVVGHEAFGKWLGHEGRALRIGVSALMRSHRASSSLPLVGTEKSSVCHLENGSHQSLTMLNSELFFLQNCEKYYKFMLFCYHSPNGLRYLPTQKNSPQRWKRKKTVLLLNKHWTRLHEHYRCPPETGKTKRNLSLSYSQAELAHYIHVNCFYLKER